MKTIIQKEKTEKAIEILKRLCPHFKKNGTAFIDVHFGSGESYKISTIKIIEVIKKQI